MIINAENLIVGRMATIVAKKVMLGEEVVILNCERAVMTGKKDFVLGKFKQRADRGIPKKGPFLPRMPDRLVRRIIRGMLPYKNKKGKLAFERVKCYIGVPEEFKDKKAETIDGANILNKTTLKYISIREISKFLGAKVE